MSSLDRVADFHLAEPPESWGALCDLLAPAMREQVRRNHGVDMLVTCDASVMEWVRGLAPKLLAGHCENAEDVAIPFLGGCVWFVPEGRGFIRGVEVRHE